MSRTHGQMRRIAACVLALGIAGPALATAPKSAALTSAQLEARVVERRAVEAALWGMPLVNFDAMRQAYFRDAGAQYNDIMYWSHPSDWKNQTTTPNHSTIYVMFFANLKDGPVVVDIPATREASLYGAMVNAWTEPQVNVGTYGNDKGQGGKYLMLPPGYKGDVPAGYIPVQSTTFNVYALLRVITKTGDEADLAGGVDFLKDLKVYPLASAGAPAANRFIDIAGKLYDATAKFDPSFYDSLARVVAEEPVQDRDLAIMGQLRSLDIGKELTFKPDAQRREVLGRAVEEAHAYMMKLYETAGRPVWGDKRTWKTLADQKIAVETKLSFVQPGKGILLDDRANAWFAMFGPIIPPPPHVYMKSYVTGKGEALEGSNSYRLTIPANVPTTEFWSVDVYDVKTGAFIREAKVVGQDSYNRKLKTNADGTVDLWFGPKAPAGHEGNWISTKAGERFFTMFRIYGVDHPALAKGWMLNNIERIR